MIVPQFWAEGRVHRPRGAGQRQITVRRFGWSDVSQAGAQAHADQRAREAFERIVSGEKLPRREPKVPYNGAEGVPIREEILSRHDDVVVTRNAYGAHCLNTPDVLFADIDFAVSVSRRLIATCAGLLVGAAAGWGWFGNLGKGTWLILFAALILIYPVAAMMARLRIYLCGGPERLARRRIAAFLRRRPGWAIALYRTPAGFRVLALHALFDPRASEVTSCFEALGVDRLYAAMCRNQRCFRARVSPKPWRIGIAQHMRPRPGVWPVRPENRERRRAWIHDYEAAAANFASCRFLENLGSGILHAKAGRVQALHDRLAQARSGREIA